MRYAHLAAGAVPDAARATGSQQIESATNRLHVVSAVRETPAIRAHEWSAVAALQKKIDDAEAAVTKVAHDALPKIGRKRGG